MRSAIAALLAVVVVFVVEILKVCFSVVEGEAKPAGDLKTKSAAVYNSEEIN